MKKTHLRPLGYVRFSLEGIVFPTLRSIRIFNPLKMNRKKLVVPMAIIVLGLQTMLAWIYIRAFAFKANKHI